MTPTIFVDNFIECLRTKKCLNANITYRFDTYRDQFIKYQNFAIYITGEGLIVFECFNSTRFVTNIGTFNSIQEIDDDYLFNISTMHELYFTYNQIRFITERLLILYNEQIRGIAFKYEK